ncbi:MAG: hypothetical protein AAFP86_23800, partial [Planctomycetota bacterium]
PDRGGTYRWDTDPWAPDPWGPAVPGGNESGSLERRALLRAALASGLGAASGAIACVLSGPAEPRPPGVPRLWVADRGAGAVHAVDGEGIVVRTARIPRPVRVAAQSGGGVLVTTDADPVPLEVALGADGRVHSIRAAPRARPGTRASALVPQSPERWRARAARGPDETYVDRVVRSGANGGAGPRLAFRIRVPFHVAHLAPDPSGGVWCVGGRALQVLHVAHSGARSRVASWPDAEGAAAACVDGARADGADQGRCPGSVDRTCGMLWVATPGALVRIGLRAEPPARAGSRGG